MRVLAALSVPLLLSACVGWPAARGGGLLGHPDNCPGAAWSSLRSRLDTARIELDGLSRRGLESCQPALAAQIDQVLLDADRALRGELNAALALDIAALERLLENGRRNLVLMRSSGCADSAGIEQAQSRWSRTLPVMMEGLHQ